MISNLRPCPSFKSRIKGYSTILAPQYSTKRAVKAAASLQPCTLDGATHILWAGVLQPLVWLDDDEDNLPHIKIVHDAKTNNPSTTYKPVTYDVLRRTPLLRLPNDEGALYALFKDDAVPGVELAGYGPPRPHGCGGREYALCYGMLRPVYGDAVVREAGYSDGYVTLPDRYAEVPSDTPRFYLWFEPN